MSTFLVILAAGLWGLSGGLAGLLMEHGWSPLLVSWHRAAFGLVSILLWMLVRRRGAGGLPGWRLVGWSVLAGVAVAGNFAFYFLSIDSAGVAVAAVLMYSAPVFVLVASVLLRLERLTWDKAAAVASVVVGIVLLTGSYRIGLTTVPPLGVATGLLAGVSYAVFIFGFKAASAHGDAATVLVIALATVVVVLLPVVDSAALGASLTSPDMVGFVPLGVLGAGVSFIAYIVGLRRTVPTTAAVVALVEPVTATVFGRVVLGQTLSPAQAGGMALILATVTVLALRRERRS